MINRGLILVPVLSLLIVSGCARLNHNDAYPWRSPFSESAGSVTEEDLFQRLPLVLARHGYLIELQQRRGSVYYFETQWKNRSPEREEFVGSGQTVRTRLLFRARQMGALYSLKIEAENEVLDSDRNWYAVELAQDVRSNLEELVLDLRFELSVRMRHF